MAEEKRFMSAQDVAQVMECSESYAYRVIKDLNAELQEKGFLIMRGRVSAKYFRERLYDGAKL